MQNIKCLIQKSPEDKRDFIAEDILSMEVSLPPSLNLSKDMPAIRNQGSQGSCVAMAAAAVKEWEENKDIGYRGYMSPQFIYNLRSNSPGDGMFMRDLMKILNKTGVVMETDYPYGSTGQITPELKEKASNFIIKAYAQVLTVEGMKAALVASGPCVLTVPVNNYGVRMWKEETGDVYRGGHALAVVGYNTTGFLLRNSWGEDWGVMGYTVFPYTDWGYRWEAWTVVDANTNPSVLRKEASESLQEWKRKFFGR